VAEAGPRELLAETIEVEGGDAAEAERALDGAVDGVSDCGGLHLYPDVPRAVSEMARVLRPHGAVAGLTFRAHGGLAFAAIERTLRLGGITAFDFDRLGEEFARAGFGHWRWEGRSVIAWFSARRHG
jgi:ubiquinone/menaquinone biosynthesis C-methylase UbiE